MSGIDLLSLIMAALAGVATGQDITGDGEPDLVLSHWSGGAHCCFAVSVVSLRDPSRVIDTIDAGHGFAGFQDLDGDGVPEFLGYDWTFAYWNASFAASPAPQIVLRYRNGRYVIDPILMKKPLSDVAPHVRDESLAQAECTSGNAWTRNGYCVTADIWGHMLDLIYAGHPEEAWRFLDAMWQGDESSRQAFVADFKNRLALSEYAP